MYSGFSVTVIISECVSDPPSIRSDADVSILNFRLFQIGKVIKIS